MKKTDLSFRLLTAVILAGVIVALTSPAPAADAAKPDRVAAALLPVPAGG
jgi:hypothetical protein